MRVGEKYTFKAVDLVCERDRSDTLRWLLVATAAEIDAERKQKAAEEAAAAEAARVAQEKAVAAEAARVAQERAAAAEAARVAQEQAAAAQRQAAPRYVAPAPAAPAPAPAPAFAYANCSAARAAGAAPVYAGQPGYGPHLDRDSDGIGCE